MAGRHSLLGRSSVIVLALLTAGILAVSGAAPASAAGTLPLGTVTVKGPASGSCAQDFTCTEFVVTCPKISRALTGTLAMRDAVGTPRGLAVFFRGGSGGEWWSTISPTAPAHLDALHQAGFALAQIDWQHDWLSASADERNGPAVMACQPATVAKWVHDTEYLPLHAPERADGSCGYCIVGSSGGGSEVAYTLSHFDLEGILDGVFPIGGPVHSSIAKGCSGKPEDLDWAYTRENGANIDRSYGFTDPGPCAGHDTSWNGKWDKASIAIGGSDYIHRHTRVCVILGKKDMGPAPAQAQDWIDKLRAEGSPIVKRRMVGGMRHVPNAAGLDVLNAALLE